MEPRKLKIGKVALISDAVAVSIVFVIAVGITVSVVKYGYSFADVFEQNTELLIGCIVLLVGGAIDLVRNVLILKTGVEVDGEGVTVRYLKGFSLQSVRLGYSEISGISSEQKLNEKIWRMGTLCILAKSGKAYKIRFAEKPWEYAQWLKETVKEKTAPQAEAAA